MSDAVGHRHHNAVLQSAGGGHGLGRDAAPAPRFALIVVGDPVGAVDDDVGPMEGLASLSIDFCTLAEKPFKETRVMMDSATQMTKTKACLRDWIIWRPMKVICTKWFFISVL